MNWKRCPGCQQYFYQGCSSPGFHGVRHDVCKSCQPVVGRAAANLFCAMATQYQRILRSKSFDMARYAAKDAVFTTLYGGLADEGPDIVRLLERAEKAAYFVDLYGRSPKFWMEDGKVLGDQDTLARYSGLRQRPDPEVGGTDIKTGKSATRNQVKAGEELHREVESALEELDQLINDLEAARDVDDIDGMKESLRSMTAKLKHPSYSTGTETGRLATNGPNRSARALYSGYQQSIPSTELEFRNPFFDFWSLGLSDEDVSRSLEQYDFNYGDLEKRVLSETHEFRCPGCGVTTPTTAEEKYRVRSNKSVTKSCGCGTRYVAWGGRTSPDKFDNTYECPACNLTRVLDAETEQRLQAVISMHCNCSCGSSHRIFYGEHGVFPAQ